MVVDDATEDEISVNTYNSKWIQVSHSFSVTSLQVSLPSTKASHLVPPSGSWIYTFIRNSFIERKKPMQF